MIVTTDVRRLALEVVGNAALVFLAVSAAVAGVAAASGLELAGFGAWPDTVILLLGLIIVGWAYDTGPLKRVHLSPAVTGAALLGRRISGGVAVNHWLAQGVGLLLAGVGLWFALPWMLPEAEQGTALQAGEPIVFTPANIIIAAIVAVVLLAVPFIVAAVLSTLRGPSVATLVAQAAADDESHDDESHDDETATEDTAQEPTPAEPESAATALEPAPVVVAPEPVTPEAVLDDLEDLFVPVPDPEPAPVREPALSPAMALFSSDERNAHLREFLGIPTRSEATQMLNEAMASATPAQPDEPAESVPAPAPAVARSEPTVLARTQDARGNLAIVRALPVPVESDDKKKRKKRRKKDKPGSPAPANVGDRYNVTVNINMADIASAAKSGSKKGKRS